MVLIKDFLGLFNSSLFEKLNPYYHRHQSPFHRGINWPSHLLHKATYFSLKNNRVKFHSWIPTRYSSRLSWLIQFITLKKVKTLSPSPSVPFHRDINWPCSHFILPWSPGLPPRGRPLRVQYNMNTTNSYFSPIDISFGCFASASEIKQVTLVS